MERQRQLAEPMVARLMNPGYPIDAVDVGLIHPVPHRTKGHAEGGFLPDLPAAG
jgi:hypothetical protein